MLNEKQIYNDIVKATGASTATISRVNRSINEGFELAFERLK
jgi:TrpR-related protein YerC/YecD